MSADNITKTIDVIKAAAFPTLVVIIAFFGVRLINSVDNLSESMQSTREMIKILDIKMNTHESRIQSIEGNINTMNANKIKELEKELERLNNLKIDKRK